MDVKVGQSDREQRVVFGGLHLEVPRPQELALGQGRVDGICQAEDGLRAGPGEKLVATAQDALPGQHVLLTAVVALVIGAEVDGGQPQYPGLLVEAVLRLDRGTGRLDEQRPGVCQPQRGSQVDRQPSFGFCRLGGPQTGGVGPLDARRHRQAGGRRCHLWHPGGGLRRSRPRFHLERQDNDEHGGRNDGAQNARPPFLVAKAVVRGVALRAYLSWIGRLSGPTIPEGTTSPPRPPARPATTVTVYLRLRLPVSAKEGGLP